MALDICGYFDESEQNDVSFCLAGWFAPKGQWAYFEESWLAILDEEGISPEFKMADCFARKGVFETWDDPTERQRVADRLLDLVLDHDGLMPSGLVIGFDLAAFDEIMAPVIRTNKPTYDKAWLWAFTYAVKEMVGAQAYASEMAGRSEQVSLSFDNHQEFKGRAKKYVEDARVADPDIRDHLGSFGFGDSKAQPAIQMADLLAWEARRAISEFLESGRSPTRPQWRSIYHAKRRDGGPRVIPYVLDRGKLDEYARAYPGYP